MDPIAPPTETVEAPSTPAADAPAEVEQPSSIVETGDSEIPSEEPQDEPADEAVDDEPAEEPAAEPEKPAAEPVATFNADALAKAQETSTTLSKQQEAIDAEFEEIDRQIKAGEIDPIEAAPKVQILDAKQRTLERKQKANAEELSSHKAAQKAATDTAWQSIGKKYADVAETPEKAATLLQKEWETIIADVTKATPNASKDYIQGKAEAKWEQKITILRARRKNAPEPKEEKPLPPRQRLTPGPGTSPAPSRRETAAERVRRTVGSLSEWKI